MKLKKVSFRLAIGFIVILIIAISIFMADDVYALSKYGSRGSEVTTIQTKLKRWKYYTGSIDGI